MYLGFIKIFTMKGATSGSHARFLLHQKNVFLEIVYSLCYLYTLQRKDYYIKTIL